MIKLDDLFPNMVVGDRSLNTWNYLRCEVPHLWYVDRRSPIMGFISLDEAAILYNLALAVRSKPVLEIGCWRGWSTAHIAAAGVALDVIDPILMEDEINQEINAILRAQRTDRVRLHGGYSPEAIFAAHKTRGEDWGLIFIDGDHEGNAPSIDAANACLFAADDAMILFHDLSSPSVAAGLGLLRERGWNTMVYQTMQIMGVAWRGNVTPVHHIPDPRVNWSLPAHLESYPVSGETLSERCKRLEQLAAHALKYERNRAAALDELRRLYLQIGSLNPAVAERDGQIANLNQAVAERDGQIALLQSEGDELRAERAELQKQLQDMEATIAAIRCSTSWRITYPLRATKRVLGLEARRVGKSGGGNAE